jgi:ammonia channel protein AmtB
LKLSAIDVTLYLGAFDKAPTGAKMTTSELGLFVLMAIACILWAIVSYSIGFKEGHKEGYQRGRSVSRHISAKAVAK